MALSAVRQVLMGYAYLIRAEQNELRRIFELIFRLNSAEIGLLYAALEALLGEADLFGEEGLFAGLDENAVLLAFGALLPLVLSLEVPNLEGLRALCYGWGLTQQETEDMVMLIVSVAAEEPLIAAMIAADDLIGGGNAGLYANGPVQNAGGCTDSAETENAIILACANFYPIAVAIREEAAVVLDLDLNEEAKAFLANLFAILFLTCYFADYPEHVNIWLVGKGEEPIDFGGSMSQAGGIASQMNDLFGENAGGFLKQMDTSKLNKFALDTTQKMSYTKNSNNSQQSSSSSSGVDIGEINPIRYRGYYWDAETEYYFLQTRYYSPEWRRFINADCMFIAGNPLTASNMYAYCDGNPVMRIDPRGMSSQSVSANLAQALTLISYVGVAMEIMYNMGMSLQKIEALWGGIDPAFIMSTAKNTIKMFESGYKLIFAPDGGVFNLMQFVAPHQVLAYIEAAETFIKGSILGAVGVFGIYGAGIGIAEYGVYPLLFWGADIVKGFINTPLPGTTGAFAGAWFNVLANGAKAVGNSANVLLDWFASSAAPELRAILSRGSGFIITADNMIREWSSRGDFGFGVYPWVWAKR